MKWNGMDSPSATFCLGWDGEVKEGEGSKEWGERGNCGESLKVVNLYCNTYCCSPNPG